MKTTIATAAILLTVSLTACAGPAKDAQYKDVNDLGRAYEQATGVKCDETKNDIAKYGWIQTGCGKTANVMLFTSDSKRDEIKGKNPLKPGMRYVQGGNWLLSADQYEAEKAQQGLGGQILGQ
ncbi:MAG TPA: hypothetical protein VF867_15305 [Arthrobacter sp.]